MRFLKKSTSIILALSMLLVCSVNVFASTTSPITISDVRFADSATNTNCVEVTVDFDIDESASPAWITMLFSSVALGDENLDNTKILYVNQIAKPAANTYKFLVDKTDLTEGSTYYMSMGGTDIAAPGSTDKQYSASTSADKEITGIGFADATYDYDGTEKSIVITGTLPEGTSVVYSRADAATNGNKATNAGTYAVTATVSGTGYTTLTKTATLTINKKVVNVKADDKEVVAGTAANEVVLTATKDELIGSDEYTGTLVTDYTAEATAGQTFEIKQGTLTAGPNYEINFTKGTLTVKAASTPGGDTDPSVDISSVAITGATAPAKGEAPVKSVTAPESVEASIKWTTEDGADFAGSVFAKETVYKAVITVAPKADYVFASNVAFTLDGEAVDAEKNGDNYVITKTFPATGSANTLLGKVALSNEAPTYGDTITAIATPDYNGEPDGELSYQWYRGGVAIDGATNAAYTAGKSDVGQVLTVKVKSSTNSGEIEAATAAVAKKTLTVTGLDVAIKEYDGTTNATITGGTLTGVLAGDTVTVSATGEFASSNAGADIPVSATAILGGADAAYYTVEQPTGLTGTITTRKITVTADDKTVRVGATELPALTYKVTSGSLVEGETLTGALATDATTDVEQDFDIVQGTLEATSNYDLTFVKGTLSVVNKATQTITIEDVATKTYGGEPFALVVETNASEENPAMTFASDNEKVATVDENGLVTIKGAGKANITVSAAATENFAAATAKAEVVIDPKAVTVDSVDWKNKTATLSGVINEDKVELDFDKVKTTTLSVGDPTVGEDGKTYITSTLTLTNLKLKGDDADNYVVTTEKLEGITETSEVKTVIDEAGVDVKVSTAGNTVVVSDITIPEAGEITNITIDAKTQVETANKVEIPVDKVETVADTTASLEIKLKDDIEVTFNNDALVQIKEKATVVSASAKVSVSVDVVEKDELQVAQKDKVEAVSEKSPVVYSLSVKADGTAIAGEGTGGFGTGGKAIVKLPYVKPEGNGNIIVKYLKTTGEEVTIPNPIYDEINKLVRAELDHFSEYLVYTEPYVYTGGGGGSSTYTVRFNSNGGSAVKSISVKKNGTVTEPTAPTKEGYEFAGWYTDSALTKAYDFSTAVTKTITLYAKWNEVEKDPEDDKPGTDEPVIDEPATGITFSDVKANDWFYDSVKFVVDNKLMNGVSATNFAPNDSLTRAMLVTILFRNEGEVAVNKSIPFSDVDMGSYYAEAVIWAKQHGIVNGATENEFAPDANITREQIAAIMHRYAQYKGFDVTVGETADITSYTDAAAVSEYAVDAMKYVVGNGLINGKTATTLNPADNATRAEIAAILQRFITNNSK